MLPNYFFILAFMTYNFSFLCIVINDFILILRLCENLFSILVFCLIKFNARSVRILLIIVNIYFNILFAIFTNSYGLSTK